MSTAAFAPPVSSRCVNADNTALLGGRCAYLESRVLACKSPRGFGCWVVRARLRFPVAAGRNLRVGSRLMTLFQPTFYASLLIIVTLVILLLLGLNFACWFVFRW